MEMTADQAELFTFPTIEAKSPARSPMRQLFDAIEKHGPLLPPAVLPVVLDLSKQRVSQLLSEDRLATVEVCGRKWVPMQALDFFLSEERRNGRPCKELTLSESWRRHVK